LDITGNTPNDSRVTMIAQRGITLTIVRTNPETGMKPKKVKYTIRQIGCFLAHGSAMPPRPSSIGPTISMNFKLTGAGIAGRKAKTS
jgi:hypothetical protein